MFVILCYCACNFVCCVLFSVRVYVILCIVVPLPPGTYPLAVNKIIIIIIIIIIINEIKRIDTSSDTLC